MIKKALSFIAASAITISLVSCGSSTASHPHEPGAPATCVAPQVCVLCGEVLNAPTGHQAGEEAGCETSQICTVCGEILMDPVGHVPDGEPSCSKGVTCTRCGQVISLPLEHNVDENGKCSKCGMDIIPEGQVYNAPGKGDAESDDTSGLIPETQNSGHYNNDIDAYYQNAVLVCGDYGIEYALPNEDGDESYAGIVNRFAEKYPALNVTCLLIPKCSTFETPNGFTDGYEDTYNYIHNTYAMLNDGIKGADAIGVMTEHAGEYMFYRTDHHWNSLGAYYASVAYCQANNIKPLALSSYDSVIRTDVTGTLYYYGNEDSQLLRNPDYTVIRFPQTGYSMVCNNGGWFDAVAVNPNYSGYASVFMCGDQPLTVITTGNKNGKTLMIFKESYGNAFAPYMIDYYEQVIVCDIREDCQSVQSLISEYDVTDVLFINNVQGAASLQDSLSSKAFS